ncbi:uncharacterized protein E5676_scaffold120G00320 [Cucumis melo var. makuwa]|uniref:Uncharacterized protein n=1 Tax=Cucumis melo var. makuwa TaxID=1194695 RepID=A0A5A7VFY4_CUCMM|nr:uncharacterized protein E6C27_scaffold62G00900 [Cucumis melo var. makuwa]TYK28945.1 uncharacterized protein E5676_scaffold120G00320 [Cucumis melo var. makuwa]
MSFVKWMTVMKAKLGSAKSPNLVGRRWEIETENSLLVTKTFNLESRSKCTDARVIHQLIRSIILSPFSLHSFASEKLLSPPFLLPFSIQPAVNSIPGMEARKILSLSEIKLRWFLKEISNSLHGPGNVFLLRNGYDENGSTRLLTFMSNTENALIKLAEGSLEEFVGSPSQTPFPLSRKKRASAFEAPFSVSSEEDDHLLKTAEKEDQSLKDPLDSDLNALFQIEEVVNFEKLVPV